MTMVALQNIDPLSLSSHRHTVVLDIRSAEERRGELGYIPGSIWLPESRIRTDPSEALSSHPGDVYVLACQSGRRSRGLLDDLSGGVEQSIYNLEGGLLGWRAAGLPVCGLEPPPASEIPPARSLDELVRVVRSCFVAESIETRLNTDRDDDDFDPVHMVRSLFDAPSDSGGPDRLHGALDRLACVAWSRGHALDKIACNVDRMRVVIGRLAEAHHE